VLLQEDLKVALVMRIVFAITAGCFFNILYNPGIIFPVQFSAFIFALFNSYYYSLEKKHK
jgi:hypothetical protein